MDLYEDHVDYFQFMRRLTRLHAAQYLSPDPDKAYDEKRERQAEERQKDQEQVKD